MGMSKRDTRGSEARAPRLETTGAEGCGWESAPLFDVRQFDELERTQIKLVLTLKSAIIQV